MIRLHELAPSGRRRPSRRSRFRPRRGCRPGEFPRSSSRIVFVQAEHRERDAFGDDDEIGVLEPQRVALDVAAVDDLEELRPELALEQIAGPASAGPSRAARVGLSEGDRVGAEFDAHRLGVGRQRDLEGERAVEPRQKLARLFGSRIVSLMLTRAPWSRPITRHLRPSDAMPTKGSPVSASRLAR